MTKQEIMVQLIRMKAEKIGAKIQSGLVCRKVFLTFYRDDFYMTVHINFRGEISCIQVLRPFDLQSEFFDKFANLETVDQFIEIMENAND
jgi:hypothetical protein